MDPDRKPHARRYWLALFFVILGAILGGLHNRAIDKGRSDGVASAARGVASPVANLFGNIASGFRNQTSWIFQGRSLASENSRLKERIAQLEGDNAFLREQAVRYDRLSADLGFVKQNAPHLLPADIVARRIDAKFETMLIAKGERDGVKVNQIVVTKNGLVGRISETASTTAVVLLVTDPKSGVGARVQRAESRALGVSKGDNSGFLKLTYLTNNADIRVGDEIVTSGMGGVFPSGIRIGIVEEVKDDPASATKVARILPAVNFDRLEEVYVQK